MRTLPAFGGCLAIVFVGVYVRCKMAFMTPCIHVCKGFVLSLSELVAVCKHACFLEIPMDDAHKDFRIAFRRRCKEIDRYFSNSRLLPEGEPGHEICEVLVAPAHIKVLSFTERLISWLY